MKDRLKQLDVLRAIAILLVIGYHLPVKGSAVPWYLIPIKKCGWTGVDLFFVLSGFLVSGLLLKEYQKHKQVDLIRFFVRRGLKIYPAFYVFLIITAVSGRLSGLVGNLGMASGVNVMKEAFFVQNYFFGIWSNTWSLAVEEHFYLSLGLLIYFLVRKTNPNKNALSAIIFVFAFVSVSCLLMRTGRSIFYWPEPVRNQFLTHLRVDSLLFGVLLSYLYHFKSEVLHQWVSLKRRALTVLSAALVSICLIFDCESFFMQTVGFTFLYLGYGGFLLLFVLDAERKYSLLPGKFMNSLAAIGKYSYSIYLWHTPILFWGPLLICGIGERSNKNLSEPGLWLFSAAAIAIGIFAAKVVEMPFLALRDRIYPSKSGVLINAGSQDISVPVAQHSR